MVGRGRVWTRGPGRQLAHRRPRPVLRRHAGTPRDASRPVTARWQAVALGACGPEDVPALSGAGSAGAGDGASARLDGALGAGWPWLDAQPPGAWSWRSSSLRSPNRNLASSGFPGFPYGPH